jgi:hypothetical protein
LFVNKFENKTVFILPDNFITFPNVSKLTGTVTTSFSSADYNPPPVFHAVGAFEMMHCFYKLSHVAISSLNPALYLSTPELRFDTDTTLEECWDSRMRGDKAGLCSTLRCSQLTVSPRSVSRTNVVRPG